MHWILTWIIVIGVMTGLIMGTGTIFELYTWILLLPFRIVIGLVKAIISLF